MKISCAFKCLLISIFVSFLAGCGGGDSSVSFLSLKGSTSDSFKVASAKSSQQFVLIPFSADSYANDVDPSGQVIYTVDFSVSTKEPSNRIAVSKTGRSDERATLKLIDGSLYEERLKFEKKRHEDTGIILKKISEGIKDKPKGYLKQKYGVSLSKLSGYLKSDVNYALADTIKIYSPFDENSDGDPDNTPLTGTLAATGTESAIYVDDRDSISTETAESLLSVFDQVTIKRNRAFWGEESDVNGDGMVIIFLSTHIGEKIVGFFRPLDLLPQDLVDDFVGSEYKTNYMEIIFSQVPESSPSIYKELIDATLAHEFYHLINFAVKTVSPLIDEGKLIQESLWLNEAMAHLTEDIVGLGADAFPTAGKYLDSASQTSVAGSVDPVLDIGFGNDTLERRGAGMLLLRYLFEQKGAAKYSSSDAGSVSGGGADFLRRLNSSSYTGIKNLEKNYGSSFESMFRRWIAALTLDGTGLSDSSAYNYISEEVDSYTGQRRGFNLRGSRTLPTGVTVDLQGPTLESAITSTSGYNNFSGQVYESGAEFYRLDVDPSTEVNITLSGQQGIGLGMTIVKIK